MLVIDSKSKSRNQKIDKDASLIETSIKRFQITAEAESETRRKSLEDLKFSIGVGQWDAAVKSNRDLEGKPCLTVNRAPAFLRQFTGEERQHRPSMLVSPVGSGADQETAKIHQGVLRHIEVVSVADVTYDSAYDMGLRIGWCPWRVTADYVNERSFDQEPRIEFMENPFAIYLSPVRRPDGTDPLWGHVIRDYSKDEYKAEFGKTQMTQLRFPRTAGAAEPSWVTKIGCRVAEYWWIELQRKQLVLFDDGTTALRDEIRKDEKRSIVDERETTVRKVNCVKHNALEVLETYEWLGRYLPFPEFNATRLNVDGKIYRSGMVRDYRDAQRVYDVLITKGVEQIDLYAKDPMLVPEENEQYMEFYRQMNRKNYAGIPYKAYTKDGKQLPVPQRAGRDVPVQAITQFIQQADYDMKAVIGIYGPSLGEESGNADESGFAILTRQQQSETSSVPWHDNLNVAIAYQGKILLDLWPKLIGPARLQRIVNPDDSVKHAVVFSSAGVTDPAELAAMQSQAQAMLVKAQGTKQAYDVGVGDYDLVMSTGPQYKTARQEAFRALTVVISQQPELLPVLGDIWAKNADFPDADVICTRLKKMQPPQLQDSDSTDPQAVIAQKDAQLAALSQQHNQLTIELNRAADTIRTKRLDIESRERIALFQAQKDILIQMMKDHTGANQAALEASLQAINARILALHGNESVDEDAGSESGSSPLPGSVQPKTLGVTPAPPTPSRPQMIPTGLTQ